MGEFGLVFAVGAATPLPKTNGRTFNETPACLPGFGSATAGGGGR